MPGRLGLVLIGVAVLLGLGAANSQAQGKRAGVEFSVEPSALHVQFPPPGPFDFLDRQTAVHKVSVGLDWSGPPGLERQVEDDVWSLLLRAEAPAMSGSGKDARDVQWRVLGAGSWQSIEHGDRLVAVQSATEVVHLEFRVRLRWDQDAPGGYSLPVRYTAVVEAR